MLKAYRRGLAADMVQFRDATGGWGVIWTVPPNSPDALERAARQMVRCRAVRVRHVRRGRLTPRDSQALDVIIVTEAPPVIQVARCLTSSRVVAVDHFLADHGLRVLLEAVTVPPRRTPTSPYSGST